MEDSRDSFVQILPFRGRNIFHNNHLSDVGALQFYGIGLENVVSENKLERMAGLVSWGQWRGLVPRTASDREERSGGAQQGRVQVCRNSAASPLIRMPDSVRHYVHRCHDVRKASDCNIDCRNNHVECVV